MSLKTLVRDFVDPCAKYREENWPGDWPRSSDGFVMMEETESLKLFQAFEHLRQAGPRVDMSFKIEPGMGFEEFKKANRINDFGKAVSS